MKILKLFPALAVRNYRNFWLMQWIALIGFWLQLTTQQWLVYELTDSAFLLGLLSAMQFTPALLFSLFIGFWIDRHSKRKILAGTQLFYIIQAFCLALLLWTGHASYGWILLFAFLLGSIDAVDMPARLAFMPSLVGKPQLQSAMALNSANFNITRMFGPLLAAFLLTYIDYGSMFFLNALSLVPIFFTYLRMHVEEPAPATEKKGAFTEIREGLLFARSHSVILCNLLSMAVVSGLIMNFGTYGPLFADRVLHRGIDGFGAILFAIGTGALAGGLISAVGSKGRSQKFLLSCAILCGALLLLVSRTSLFFPALALFAAVGFASILFLINCNTAIQRACPPLYLGRIMSLYSFVFLGSAPFGSLFVSTIIEMLGTQDGLLSIGLLEMMLLAFIGWRFSGSAGTQPE